MTDEVLDPEQSAIIALQIRSLTNCAAERAERLVHRAGLEAAQGIVHWIAMTGASLDAVEEALGVETL